MDHRLCLYCNSEYDGRKRKYCTKACSMKANSLRYYSDKKDSIVQKQKEWRKNKTFGNRNCNECGKLYAVRYTHARYCSRVCANVNSRRHRLIRPNSFLL